MAYILVIDDDDDLRGAFKQLLERFGHVVSSAANGREGLQLLKHKKPDLVITDIFMPELDGLEVILEIKKRCRRLSQDIPIIAVSGGLRTSKAEPVSFLYPAETFGADRVFPKPIDFQSLHEAIQELLPADGC